jgi:paraquat-inducible protein B
VSKKINTTSIGLFIVTGLALGVTGLLLFSSSKMFSKTRDLIVYFNDSLNGLNEGAAVKYRGVTVGSVKRVMVQFNQATNDYAMPVILEMEEKLLKERMPSFNYAFTESTMAVRIQEGLRATLETESLVTGVLYIGIDIVSNAPPAVFHQLEKIYPEIPTKPTQIQQLMQNLASLDVKALQTNLNNLILKLDATVGRLDVAQINQQVTNLLSSINRVVSSPDITNGLASIKPTLEQYRELGATLTSKVDPLSDSITNSLAEANRALAQLRGAGENLRTMLAPDAPIRNDLDLAVQQMAAAGQSISELVDFLKRNPNALIVGRQILPAKK